MQKKFDENNCQLFLVLPYAIKDIEDYAAYYDAIIIPDSISHCYPKRAITFRNQWMVDCSDLIVCYVDHKSGGAYHAVHYAETQKKQIVNIHNKGFLPIYKKTGEFYES